MIHIDEETKIIFVRGVHSMARLEQEYFEQTGKKKWNWRSYTIVGLADDNSRGLQTGMGFCPPFDGGDEIGFKYTRKNEPTRTDTERKGGR